MAVADFSLSVALHGLDNNQSILNCEFIENEANSGGGIHMEHVENRR